MKVQDLIPVKVECHAGYKADEYPMRFYWENIRLEIEEIMDRWYHGNQNPEFPAANYFKVRTADEKIFMLKHETENDKWFLWIRGESMNL